MFKDKIIASLKTEYKGLGLSDKTIDRIASYVEGLVENEDDIATAVKRDDVKLIATSIQGEIDGIRKAKQTAEEALEAYKKSHPDSAPEKKDDGKEEGGNAILDAIAALTKRLDERDARERNAATIASVKASAKADGCTDERVIRLTERLFTVKDDESEEDAAKRFKDEYDANVREYFGDSVAPYRGAGITTPVKVNDADRAAKAREDAKRVREG